MIDMVVTIQLQKSTHKLFPYIIYELAIITVKVVIALPGKQWGRSTPECRVFD